MLLCGTISHKTVSDIHTYAKYGIHKAVLLRIELVALCRRLSASRRFEATSGTTRPLSRVTLQKNRILIHKYITKWHTAYSVFASLLLPSLSLSVFLFRNFSIIQLKQSRKFCRLPGVKYNAFPFVTKMFLFTNFKNVVTYRYKQKLLFVQDRIALNASFNVCFKLHILRSVVLVLKAQKIFLVHTYLLIYAMDQSPS